MPYTYFPQKHVTTEDFKSILDQSNGHDKTIYYVDNDGVYAHDILIADVTPEIKINDHDLTQPPRNYTLTELGLLDELPSDSGVIAAYDPNRKRVRISKNVRQANGSLGIDQYTSAAKLEDIDDNVNNDSIILDTVATTGSYNDLKDLPTINGKVVKGDVIIKVGDLYDDDNNTITQIINNKQDKLVLKPGDNTIKLTPNDDGTTTIEGGYEAGEGITIEGNTIINSREYTPYSAGEGIIINDDNEISAKQMYSAGNGISISTDPDDDGKYSISCTVEGGQSFDPTTLGSATIATKDNDGNVTLATSVGVSNGKLAAGSSSITIPSVSVTNHGTGSKIATITIGGTPYEIKGDGVGTGSGSGVDVSTLNGSATVAVVGSDGNSKNYIRIHNQINQENGIISAPENSDKDVILKVIDVVTSVTPPTFSASVSDHVLSYSFNGGSVTTGNAYWNKNPF